VTHLLSDILSMLGYDEPAGTIPVDSVTVPAQSPVTRKEANSNLSGQSQDRSDQCDLDFERAAGVGAFRGRFVVGETYRIRAIQRFFALSGADRLATEQAGFQRAGIIVVEGVGLLIADVARAFIDEVALVIGFADVPATAVSVASNRKRRRRS